MKIAPRATSSLRERFLREAEMLSTIARSNVVRYLAHGVLDTHEPWLAMEWLEGEDLHDRLERAPLSLGESIALARQLASALAAAHAVGIVHRDVKPRRSPRPSDRHGQTRLVLHVARDCAFGQQRSASVQREMQSWQVARQSAP